MLADATRNRSAGAHRLEFAGQLILQLLRRDVEHHHGAIGDSNRGPGWSFSTPVQAGTVREGTVPSRHIQTKAVKEGRDLMTHPPWEDPGAGIQVPATGRAGTEVPDSSKLNNQHDQSRSLPGCRFRRNPILRQNTTVRLKPPGFRLGHQATSPPGRIVNSRSRLSNVSRYCLVSTC
jgi:hypothetical protein